MSSNDFAFGAPEGLTTEEAAKLENVKKPFVVAWEYPDGSGGWHDFDTNEEAYQYARPFFGDPLRIWINDDIVNYGFLASDERLA